MTPALRWPARNFAEAASENMPGEVCATLWPTRSLDGPLRWFDEFYLWADGFEPNAAQLTRMQLFGLEQGLGMLAREEADQIAVTLSFDTVLLCDEQIDERLRANALVAHRLSVILRGSAERVRSTYRIRAFVDYLRAQGIAVGLRVTAPRLAMDLAAFNLVQPNFAKFLAPAWTRGESWENLALEARVAGITEKWLIVAGLQLPEQLEHAARAGIGFGQGHAVRPAHRPHSDALPALEEDPLAQIPGRRDPGPLDPDRSAPDPLDPDPRDPDPLERYAQEIAQVLAAHPAPTRTK